MTHSTREQIGNRTILITVVMNIFLSLIKLLAGFIGHSTSMISDGVHSLSDVISSIGVFIGLRISKNQRILIILMGMKSLKQSSVKF